MSAVGGQSTHGDRPDVSSDLENILFVNDETAFYIQWGGKIKGVKSLTIFVWQRRHQIGGGAPSIGAGAEQGVTVRYKSELSAFRAISRILHGATSNKGITLLYIVLAFTSPLNILTTIE